MTGRCSRLVLVHGIRDIGESESQVEDHVLLQTLDALAVDDVCAFTIVDSGLYRYQAFSLLHIMAVENAFHTDSPRNRCS